MQRFLDDQAGICLMEILKLKAGKNSILSLESMATAGYTWSFDTDRPDVITVSAAPPSASANKLLPGESLKEQFLIKAIKVGRAKLVFIQKRSWELEKAAISTLVFYVAVS